MPDFFSVVPELSPPLVEDPERLGRTSAVSLSLPWREGKKVPT
jgi:hypothetical protein